MVGNILEVLTMGYDIREEFDTIEIYLSVVDKIMYNVCKRAEEFYRNERYEQAISELRKVEAFLDTVVDGEYMSIKVIHLYNHIQDEAEYYYPDYDYDEDFADLLPDDNFYF